MTPPHDVLRIRETDDGSTRRILLEGELDAFDRPALDAAITAAFAARAERVVVDLSALAFMDSTALHCLARAQELAAAAAAELVIRPAADPAQRLFALTPTGARFAFDGRAA